MIQMTGENQKCWHGLREGLKTPLTELVEGGWGCTTTFRATFSSPNLFKHLLKDWVRSAPRLDFFGQIGGGMGVGTYGWGEVPLVMDQFGDWIFSTLP